MLTLDAAVAEAHANNPRIQESMKIWKASRASFWSGISPAYPELFIEQEGSPRTTRSVSEYEVRKTGFKQGFDFPLAYVFRGQTLHALNLEERARFRSVQNQVIREVKTAFYRVLLVQEKLRAFQEIRDLSLGNMEMARVRVLAGESSPYDTLKVKVDLAEVENVLLALEKSYDLARSEIRLLIGREPAGELSVDGRLSFMPVEFDLDTLRRMAVVHHPGLQEAAAAFRQLRSERNESWMDLLPSVHIRYFRMDMRNDPNPDRWGGEFALSIPVWFLLRGQGAVRSSALRVDASRFHLIHQRRSVLLEVDRAYQHLVVARRQVENYRKNTLKEVEELVRIATRSYEEGEMGYLEMSEALKSFNRIRIGYAESIFEYLAMLADLEYAVGKPLT
jgi:outer membrane protein TolC